MQLAVLIENGQREYLGRVDSIHLVTGHCSLLKSNQVLSVVVDKGTMNGAICGKTAVPDRSIAYRCPRVAPAALPTCLRVCKISTDHWQSVTSNAHLLFCSSLASRHCDKLLCELRFLQQSRPHVIHRLPPVDSP